MIGYSYRIRKLNRAADKRNIGVQLGRICIDSEIPVKTVMEKLKVSKQTVYNWFFGIHVPGPKHAKKIQDYFLS